ncbi:MAG: lysine--tRNA ligase [Candidatus Marinimicrobia bacterium]|nr:lysine--tRNA ligase [Candidatus Neomarinimicrobiota bacterium]MCH7762157.1 lysine--tRNA ligase [Candidatus Neomarinimicrobiota bacterium]
MKDEHKSLNEIIRFRREKLDALKEKGVNPYPHNYNPTHTSGEALANYDELEGKDVTVAGRIMALRKMGKASFFHIQDMGGRIQIYIKRDDVGEDAYAHFKLMDIGDIVGVKGFLFTTKMGEKSIHAIEFTVLAKSIRPLPVVKEKDGKTFDAFEDKELRYRNRHLDLIVNPDIKNVFIKRAKIITEIRNYLDGLGFLEVETPVLQPLYGGANARPFTTHHNTLDQKLYLRIADELYLKRLIIGGFDRVYELSKDFRNEGMDRNHNPEFTMLEFYWAYADYEDNMELVEDMFRKTAEAVDAPKVTWHGNEIDLKKPFARKPLLELLKDATGQNLGSVTDDEMKTLCKSHNIDVEDNANYGQMLDNLMSELVEPKLIQPTFVTDYPKAISPLAKAHRNGDPNLVERFELFIGGAEFANSFTELNDPIDQRERLEAQALLMAQGDEEAQPVDENFIQAMECGMPPTGGVGIGIDRLTMLLTEQNSIKDVILFPAMRTIDE